ncbi:hypothetical protein BJ508DRAFT_413644 [Ascobolus immersus RN42]|uniref:DNA-directed RNA polymerase III subunit RPC9 n=1 Tax=Ascobolus immersus RN42 TaxID=1160509 RepID=A0A3N4IEX7_ASCIM|nr:hypothetical protein BJ508DRAFT_413644 [Ascobolus immersus RN42]
MKVVNARDSFLTNYEVLAHLNATKAKYEEEGKATGNHAMKAGNLETVMMELRDYLRHTPSATQSDEAIESFMSRAAPFQLEKVELLMIINQRPKGLAELDVLVEELESRLSEEQIEELLGLVRECFGGEEDGGEMEVDEA